MAPSSDPVRSIVYESPAETVFVSSNRWDVAGAAAFGFAPVWVDRAGLPDEYPGLDPVAIVPDLGALPALLGRTAV